MTDHQDALEAAAIEAANDTKTPTQVEIEALVALLQRPHGNLTGSERQDVGAALTSLQAERDAAVSRADAAEKALLDAEGYLSRGHDKMAHNIIRAALSPYTKGE